MAIFVVDASVALAWCFEDETSTFADALETLRKLARPARFERATLCLEGRRSIQLSYGRAA
jgi:hypothetical protein